MKEQESDYSLSTTDCINCRHTIATRCQLLTRICIEVHLIDTDKLCTRHSNSEVDVFYRTVCVGSGVDSSEIVVPVCVSEHRCSTVIVIHGSSVTSLNYLREIY